MERIYIHKNADEWKNRLKLLSFCQKIRNCTRETIAGLVFVGRTLAVAGMMWLVRWLMMRDLLAAVALWDAVVCDGLLKGHIYALRLTILLPFRVLGVAFVYL